MKDMRCHDVLRERVDRKWRRFLIQKGVSRRNPAFDCVFFIKDLLKALARRLKYMLENKQKKAEMRRVMIFSV